MEQLKFALGPYELFASVLGGLPLSIALLITFGSGSTLQNAITLFQSGLSIQTVILGAVASYLIGGLFQGITWRFFLLLCRLSKRVPYYFDENAIRQWRVAPQPSALSEPPTFEHRLVALLDKHMGIPPRLSWLDARLQSYLKENNRPSAVTADMFQASHIMYRNLCFGLVAIALTLPTLLVRSQISPLGALGGVMGALGLAYVAFYRALSFKRWHQRELILGFYFAVTGLNGETDDIRP